MVSASATPNTMRGKHKLQLSVIQPQRLAQRSRCVDRPLPLQVLRADGDSGTRSSSTRDGLRDLDIVVTSVQIGDAPKRVPANTLEISGICSASANNGDHCCPISRTGNYRLVQRLNTRQIVMVEHILNIRSVGRCLTMHVNAQVGITVDSFWFSSFTVTCPRLKKSEKRQPQ